MTPDPVYECPSGHRLEKTKNGRWLCRVENLYVGDDQRMIIGPEQTLWRLEQILNDSDIANTPTGPVQDKIVSAEQEISGFRYQIVVGGLARTASEGIPKGVTPTDAEVYERVGTVVTDHMRQHRSFLDTVDLIRWSDALRVQGESYIGDNGSGVGLKEMTGEELLRSIAESSLFRDVLRCLKTGEF